MLSLFLKAFADSNTLSRQLDFQWRRANRQAPPSRLQTPHLLLKYFLTKKKIVVKKNFLGILRRALWNPNFPA